MFEGPDGRCILCRQRPARAVVLHGWRYDRLPRRRFKDALDVDGFARSAAHLQVLARILRHAVVETAVWAHGVQETGVRLLARRAHPQLVLLLAAVRTLHAVVVLVVSQRAVLALRRRRMDFSA